MSLIKEIVKEFLIENVSVGRVNDAINKTYEVEINYHSDGEDIATGKRIIQPVAYGLTKIGNPVIRAFQPYGDTTSSIPAWKFFRLDRISSWKPFPNRTFKEPPAEFNANGDFNPNGDKTMSVVYTIANFSNDNAVNYSQMNNIGPITKNKVESDIYKTDTEKGIEYLRKQLDNPKYISDLVKTKNFGDKSMNATSGPVTKDDVTNNNENTPLDSINEPDIYKTDTEKDIEKRRETLNNPQKVSQDVLDNWRKENNLTNNI